MPEAWESSTGDEQWSDREAWRGDLHVDHVDQWRQQDAGEGWVWNGEDEEQQDESAEAEWPEDLAGPEYWLFKRDCDE